MQERLVTITEASLLLGVSKTSLRRWDRNHSLVAARTIGGNRRYKLSDIKELQGVPLVDDAEALIAIYCRVSSHEQKKKGDLERQKLRVLEYCAAHSYIVPYIFEEVGSGLNDNRPKLHRLFNLATHKKINRIVVEHKDRLTRFNFSIFNTFFNSHGVEVELIEQVLPKTYEAELIEDMLSLISSFSSKVYEIASQFGAPSHSPVCRYSSIEAAALRPAPMARITVAAPVTMSPPAKTPFFEVRSVSGSAAM